MSKIAFVFPGQGTQYVGMGKGMYESSQEAKKIFDNIFNSVGEELKEIMFNGPEEKLKITKYTQPAVVAYTLILAELMKKKGIIPDYVAGHSLGEYSALGFSGVLSIEDTVRLTSVRGTIMSEVSDEVKGTMCAVLGMESSKILEICSTIDGIVEPVNFNEPLQTVIAGEISAVEKAAEKIKEAGAKRVLPLAVSGPFHSSLMKPAGDRLKDEFSKFNFKDSEIVIIANTNTKELNKSEDIKEELYYQTFGPVKWVDTVTKLKELGVTRIYEIGPGKVLSGLIRKIDKAIEVINVEKIEDIEAL